MSLGQHPPEIAELACQVGPGHVCCQECRVRFLSICAALGAEELHELTAINRLACFDAKAVLFLQDEPAQAVYNITEGAVRLLRLLPDGRRQIVGFALPGDFLGLSLADRYSFGAEAIDHVKACRFDRKTFADFVDAKPHLLRKLHGFATHELAVAQEQMVVLGRRRAEEKVAAFLIGLRNRWSRIDGARVHVPLPMSRQDIADFLGLTIETVSRIVSRFGRERKLVVVPDGVRLLDPVGMEKLAAA
jgi:CRP/FNR family transcriptional regulator